MNLTIRISCIFSISTGLKIKTNNTLIPNVRDFILDLREFILDTQEFISALEITCLGPIMSLRQYDSKANYSSI